MSEESAHRAPIDRMLRIHEELQRGAFTNCTKLGLLLEVSRKTLVRDIAFMKDRLRLPIEFDSHHNAYRYTRHVASFPTVHVTEGEVFALLVARKALEQYRGTSFYSQLATSFEKLSAGLKDRIEFSPTDELQVVSFKNVGLGKADVTVFNELSTAVIRQCEVEFGYRKPGEQKPSLRRVRPYHLTHRENLWYLIAFDLQRSALRTFALPRLSSPTLLKTRFQRPSDFSPEKFFATALGVLGGEGNYQVLIRFTAAVADRVREREWHHTQKLRDLPNGGLEIALRLGALAEIERWILTWGADAEVLQPQELRESLKKIATRLVKKYRSGIT